MKKRVLIIAVIIIVAIAIAACAKPVQTLSISELLDLGEKYLVEFNYKQALVQFLKVIEVEPMNPRGYTGAAEAYIGLDDTERAIEVLSQGLERLPDDITIKAMLDDLTIKDMPDELTPIAQLEKMPLIEFSIDGIMLGETDLSVAKSKYSSREDYMTNLMGNNEDHNNEDTVNSMPYEDDDNPDNDMDFGYLFVQPVNGSSIQVMFSTDSTLLCLGKYRVGDDASLLLNDFFGFDDITVLKSGEYIFYNDNSSKLTLTKWDNGEFLLACNISENHLRIWAENSKITRFDLLTEESLLNN